MNEVTVLPDARAELLAQAVYYQGKKTPDTVLRWLDRTDETFQFLLKNPQIGTPWESPLPRLAGVRTWPVAGFETFIVFYRPTDSGIEVLHVLLGSRHLDSAVSNRAEFAAPPGG